VVITLKSVAPLRITAKAMMPHAMTGCLRAVSLMDSTKSLPSFALASLSAICRATFITFGEIMKKR